jgi:hypothetical protein
LLIYSLVYSRNVFYQLKCNVLFAYCKHVGLKQILPKQLCLPTQLHGIKFQKAVISTFNALKNSNLKELNFPETLNLLIIWIITTVRPDRNEQKASRVAYTVTGGMTL